MAKKEEETIVQDQQLTEQQTTLEKQIADRPKVEKPILPNSTAKTTKVDFGFSNNTLANEEEMSQVRDILTSGEEQSEDLFQQELMFLSVEEVARFLELAYEIQGMVTYKDLWKREKSFYYEIAEGILPHLNSWAMRVPALGHAIKTGSAAGSWGRLILDLGGTWIFVYKRKQLEAEQKQKEEGKQTNESNRNQPTNGIFVP